VAFDIKTVDPAEFRAWRQTLATAFFRGSEAEAAAEALIPHIDFTRTWAAFDGPRIIGTFRSFGTQLTVPGGAMLVADAVTNVSTLPTHRRRGVMTGMMKTSLNAAMKRRDPLSILIAARWPIYGRYGYGAAADGASYEIDATGADFGSSGREGSLEYIDKSEGRGVAERVFEKFRRSQIGAIPRTAFDLDLDFGVDTPPGRTAWDGRTVVYRGQGRGDVEGYLRYHVDDNWEGMHPRCVLVVDDLVTTTPAAYAALWRLSCEVDNIMTVKASDRSVDEVLPWLLADARAITQTSRSDFVWARLLDVAAALSGRRYLTEGRLVLEVHDKLGHSSGRYLLEGGPLGATCKPSTRSANLELDVATLSSAFLGGPRLRPMALAGLVTERRKGALDLADSMFRAESTPWCNTWF
jgi:predicted acetyltransferase